MTDTLASLALSLEARQSLVAAGMVRLPTPRAKAPPWRRTAKKNNDHYIRKRDRFFAQGKNANGKPRKRSAGISLVEMKTKEILDRKRQQCRECYHRKSAREARPHRISKYYVQRPC